MCGIHMTYRFAVDRVPLGQLPHQATALRRVRELGVRSCEVSKGPRGLRWIGGPVGVEPSRAETEGFADLGLCTREGGATED